MNEGRAPLAVTEVLENGDEEFVGDNCVSVGRGMTSVGVLDTVGGSVDDCGVPDAVRRALSDSAEMLCDAVSASVKLIDGDLTMIFVTESEAEGAVGLGDSLRERDPDLDPVALSVSEGDDTLLAVVVVDLDCESAAEVTDDDLVTTTVGTLWEGDRERSDTVDEPVCSVVTLTDVTVREPESKIGEAVRVVETLTDRERLGECEGVAALSELD